MLVESTIKKIIVGQQYGFFVNPIDPERGDIYFQFRRRVVREKDYFRNLKPHEADARLKLVEGMPVCCNVAMVNGRPQAEYWALVPN